MKKMYFFLSLTHNNIQIFQFHRLKENILEKVIFLKLIYLATMGDSYFETFFFIQLKRTSIKRGKENTRILVF